MNQMRSFLFLHLQFDDQTALRFDFIEPFAGLIEFLRITSGIIIELQFVVLGDIEASSFRELESLVRHFKVMVAIRYLSGMQFLLHDPTGDGVFMLADTA